MLSVINLYYWYNIDIQNQKSMAEVTQSILFRQRLYENFKESGLLSQLKTTLRTNLLQQLQKPYTINNLTNQKQLQQQKKPIYLRDKFLACIVQQYLKKTNKQYSLSIFMPECNMENEDFLNYNELAQITNIQILQQNNISFLQILVREWTKFRTAEIRQRSTQTDFSQPLSKKLQDIQKQYRPKIDYWKLMTNTKSLSQNISTDADLLAKQQRMIEQFQIQKKKVRRDLQLSVKAQIQKKYQSHFDFRTRQMQKAHEGRLTQLKNREKAILQSLNRKTKQLQQKSRSINQQQLKMIKKYQQKILQLQLQHKRKIKELQNKQKQFWKKQLELKAKKRQYQDTIRLVKQKVVEQTLDV